MSDRPSERPMGRLLDLGEDLAVSQALLRGIGGRFASFFDDAGFGMAVAGTDGEIVVANEALASMTGRSEGALLSGGLASLLEPEELARLRAGMDAALSGGDPSMEIEAAIRTDGAPAWVLLSATLVRDDRERPLGFLLQVHDVSERHRELEEVREADARKTKMVAVASHELRTPLTSVLGFSKMLLRYWDSVSESDRREYLSQVVEQGERLARLVGDLLTLSRIEGRSINVEPEEIEVLPWARRVLGTLSCPTEVRLKGADGVRVVADPHHLEQILSNLVTNAFKYGSPPVEVELRDAGPSVELRVKDRGDGVPEEFVPRLFDAFARADSGRARTQGGTGLGLSIVRGLARAQGGDVWYERNEPLGACFVARLPAPA